MSITALTALLAFCASAYAQDAPGPDAGQPQDVREEIALEALLQEVAANSDKEFLIDRRARPQVYVGGTSLEDPTYPTLLSILSANGLAAVEIRGRVHVVPMDDARQLPGRLVQRDDPAIPDDEWVTRIITVNGNAARLVPILRPLMPQAAHLAAMVGEDGTSNKLIVVDRYANVRRVTDMVDVLTQ